MDLRAKRAVFLSYVDEMYSVLYMLGCDGNSWHLNSDSRDSAAVGVN
jgi:hypothetical protein